MKLLRALVCVVLLALQTSPALAWRQGLFVPPNGIQMNVSDLVGGVFINALKANFGGVGSSIGNGNLPTNIDGNGYATGTLSSSISYNINMSSLAVFTGSSVQWELLWPAGCQLSTNISAGVNINLVSTVHASTAGSNATNLHVAGDNSGLAGNAIFTLASTTTGVTFSFLNGASQSCSVGGLALVRVSDLTAYNAGQIPTPEFLADHTGLNDQTMRDMGWSGVIGSNETTWAYRSTLSSFDWSNERYPPNAWGGTISGTDTYTIGAPPSGAILTDGFTIQGQIQNANTSATPTLNVNGLGPITIVNSQGASLSAGNLSSSGTNGTGLYTFVYSSVLNEFIEMSGGITGSVPIEAQISFANQAHTNLWTNIPFLATNNWVTNWATNVCSGLNSALYFQPEYSNEVWNFVQSQTSLAVAFGEALGFPNNNNRPFNGWYGLKVAQFMGATIPAACSARMSHVRRMLMFSGGGASGTVSQNETYRFQGADLAPSGVNTGTGNSLYCTYTGGTWNGSSCSGGANYSQQVTAGGNGWPIDFVEGTGYAPYAGGVNLCTGPDLSCTPSVNNVPFYNSLLAASGSAAIALVNSDVQNGQILAQTVTCSGTTFTTPSAHGFTAGSTNISFTVSGGTSYSGLVNNQMYQVDTTPLTTTFTMKAYSGGSPSGSDVNCGSAGSGTVTVGAVNRNDMLFWLNAFYPAWEAAMASYDAGRPAGMSALGVYLYEGGLEPQGPTAAQLAGLGVVSNATNVTSLSGNTVCMGSMPFSTNEQIAFTNVGSITGISIDTNYFAVSISGDCMGIATSSGGAELTLGGTVGSPVVGSTTAASNTIATAITNWKNDPSSATTMLQYLNQSMGKDSASPNFGLQLHSKVPALLQMTGPNVWSVLSGGPGSTPYQTYSGAAAYH